MKKFLLLLGICLFVSEANAQLSSNPDKFLGNITTRGQVDVGGGVEEYYKLWNQITPENESKWDAIEPSRGYFTFGGADRSANYAKLHGFPFKYHTLVWGGQYPSWMNNLSTEEQYKALEEYFDGVKDHYPDLEIIDVVNEAISGHNPAPYRAALGGEGKTGYDWIIKSFEMAHERWPNAILIYNDYNTFQWNTDQFINLVRTLRDAGAPIDAYGCQSHDMLNQDGTVLAFDSFKRSMDRLHNELMMPMYSTEYDVGTANDNYQLMAYQKQIPYMWEQDYCAGITLWGYIYGATWTTDGNSGLIKNGQDRPAMTWLREYMASDAAKNAKSPFPGMAKEASIYIKPAALKVANGDKLPILVRAKMKTMTITEVKLYADDELIATMTDAPYEANYIPTSVGTKTLKAVVTATDGTSFKTFERHSRVTVLSDTTPHTAFQGKAAEIPGIIEAENFDQGAKDIAYHDSDSKSSGETDYREDAKGVDVIKIGDGYGIGYTTSGEWLEYTVDVKEAGQYSIDIDVAAEKSGLIHFVENTLGNMNFISDFIRIPATGGADNYQTVHIRMEKPLEVGEQTFTLFFDNGNINIDKISFTRLNVDETIEVDVTAEEKTIDLDNSTQITVDATSQSSTIEYVKVYENDMFLTTLTEAPYQFEYQPTTKGTKIISAIATDANGKESTIAQFTMTVKGKRVPYHNDAIPVPGIIEAEDFDMGGERLSFHDSDDIDEGDANYRTDAEGVDMVKGNGGTAIGYTAVNEWLEYTINVTEPGDYSLEATVSSGTTGSGFSVRRIKNGSSSRLCKIEVPQTGNNNWNTYKVVKVDKLSKPLEEGEQIIRITIDGASCNIDKIELKPVSTGIDKVAADKENGKSYNLKGQQTNANYKGIVIKNGKKFINK